MQTANDLRLARYFDGSGEGAAPAEHRRVAHDLIVAGLETAMPKGELLTLTWSQVRGEIFLPAGKTKAKKPRRVPISTVLRAVLDRRRNDPAGHPLPPDAYVFGGEVGRRRQSIKTAWRLTCKRANIKDLHFHDVRREGASRWMDAGVPLATIQRWLGHHNISQTSMYLARVAAPMPTRCARLSKPQADCRMLPNSQDRTDPNRSNRALARSKMLNNT